MDNNLEKLRKSAHLTQHKLGKQLGLSQQVISRLERDISTITLEHLLLLADFYQVSIDYLLDRTKAKRSWEEQQVISEVLEEHYELVRALEMLDERDTGLVWALIEKMLEDSKE
ncbi:MAG: helix-turn-helix domain-containing protein [Hungatella sp.]